MWWKVFICLILHCSRLTVILRAFLLLTCQRFALGAFRQQLRTADAPEDDIELDTLPAPSSTPTRSASEKSHSRNLSIANIAFSLCFTESCMLFHLLMAQAVDLYNPGSRMLHWLISLFIVLSLLLAVIPVSLSLVTTSSLFFQCRTFRDITAKLRHQLISFSPGTVANPAARGLLYSFILCSFTGGAL